MRPLTVVLLHQPLGLASSAFAAEMVSTMAAAMLKDNLVIKSPLSKFRRQRISVATRCRRAPDPAGVVRGHPTGPSCPGDFVPISLCVGLFRGGGVDATRRCRR